MGLGVCYLICRHWLAGTRSFSYKTNGCIHLLCGTSNHQQSHMMQENPECITCILRNTLWERCDGGQAIQNNIIIIFLDLCITWSWVIIKELPYSLRIRAGKKPMSHEFWLVRLKKFCHDQISIIPHSQFPSTCKPSQKKTVPLILSKPCLIYILTIFCDVHDLKTNHKI